MLHERVIPLLPSILPAAGAGFLALAGPASKTVAKNSTSESFRNSFFSHLAGLKVELQVRISRRGLADVLASRLRDRGSTQVGVQDYAGCIDHRPQRILESPGQFLADGNIDIR